MGMIDRCARYSGWNSKSTDIRASSQTPAPSSVKTDSSPVDVAVDRFVTIARNLSTNSSLSSALNILKRDR